MLLTEIPPCVPKTNSTISKWLGMMILKTLRWKVTGSLPERKKFIIAIAPHTSNWDFIICIGVKLALNLRVKSMVKASLFVWPLKGLLLALGTVPIHRNSKQGVVSQMVAQFRQADELILAITPEGTRSKTDHWKKGFLLIASQANIPVVPVSIDFKKRTVNFLPAQEISDDIDSELEQFKLNFIGVCAKNPQAV